MRRNHWQNGGAKVGSIPKIHVAGSNGIADITMDAAMKMTCARLRVGAQFVGTLRS
jgi:hypothetical protein